MSISQTLPLSQKISAKLQHPTKTSHPIREYHNLSPQPTGGCHTHHTEVLHGAVLSAKVAALQHFIKLVASALEDVQHVRRRIMQLTWTVPTAAFWRQPGQVGQVVDVGISECREAEAVDVAQRDGREGELTPALLTQCGHMWVFQVGTCAPGRLVQEEHE